MLKSTLRKPQVWLGLAVSVIAIIALIWSIDLAQVLEALRNSEWGWLPLVAGGITTFLLARAVRWRILLDRVLDYQPILHVQNVGYLLGLFLPLRLGDIARTVLIGRFPPVTFWQGASTMVVERLLDLLIFVALFPFAVANLDQLPASLQNAALFSGVVALVGISIFLIMARNRPLVEQLLVDRLPVRLGNSIRQSLDGLTVFNSLPDFLLILLWSVLTWLPTAFAYNWAMRAVGLQPSIWEVAFVLCCAAFAVAIPSSPGQLGVFHAAVFFALHTILGYPEGPAIGFALIFHAVQYVVFTALGLWGLSQTGQSWRGVITLAEKNLSK
ncbi:MAG: lysylphosphatidylglycerol synthase transmembrane domain-containing protein [Ardenticatenaceae bacterium]|nr:lysylphosphatidylglycerol synthase transmembrane domain-containing protein [Ardenticatenaceae bacterium]